MRLKLTSTVDEQVHAGLHRVIGRRRRSSFMASLLRSQAVREDVAAASQQMVQDQTREAEAHRWAEATVLDVADRPRRGHEGQLRSLARRRDTEASPSRDRE